MRPSGYFIVLIWPVEQFEFETPALGTDGTVSALENFLIKTKMLMHEVRLVTFQTRFNVFLCCSFYTFGRRF